MFNSVTSTRYTGPTTLAAGSTSHIVTITAGIPAVDRTYTWREAIERASRIKDSRVRIRREGEQWAIHYFVRPIAVNYS